MPKSTFFRLNEKKRKKVDVALIKEFSRVSFEKVSITNIIKEAEIPRGSFYQYFEDKEDAINYIIKKVITVEYKKVSVILEEKKGDIFETFLYLYDYAIQESKTKDKYKLAKNILLELRKRNINILNYDKNLLKDIIKLINVENLRIKTENDILYILKVLIIIIRTTIIEFVSGAKNIEESREETIKMMELFKLGIQKNNI